MTAVTVLISWYVHQRLDQIQPVREKRDHMAAFTAEGISLVYRSQESGRQESGSRIVAHAAIILRRDMNMGTRRTGFTGRNAGIVTG